MAGIGTRRFQRAWTRVVLGGLVLWVGPSCAMDSTGADECGHDRRCLVDAPCAPDQQGCGDAPDHGNTGRPDAALPDAALPDAAAPPDAGQADAAPPPDAAAPDGPGLPDAAPDNGCSSECTVPAYCGDGTHAPMAGEQCDTGGDTATCDSDCTLPACGDGHLNQAAGEVCDTGGNSAACDSDCTLPACGDGLLNDMAVVAGTAHTEQCDRGSSNSDMPNAPCRSDCLHRRCGDGIRDTVYGEMCDGSDDDCPSGKQCTTACMCW